MSKRDERVARLKAANRAARDKLLESQPNAAVVTDEQEAEFRRAVRRQREALSPRSAPGTLVTLDRPAAIELLQAEFDQQPSAAGDQRYNVADIEKNTPRPGLVA